MKFKIDNLFREEIQNYLKAQELVYEIQENEDNQQNFVILSINTHQRDSMIVFNYQVLNKLCEEYHRAKINADEITINQWLVQYEQKLRKMLNTNQKQQSIVTSLNNQLLLHKTKVLKQNLRETKNQIKSQLQRNKQLKQKYEKVVKLQEKKAQLTLKSVQLRKQMAHNAKQNGEQELQRIQSVINNGVWGLKNQIINKIKNIKQIQKQIETMKAQKLNQSSFQP